jgi:hypothetical protein
MTIKKFEFQTITSSPTTVPASTSLVCHRSVSTVADQVSTLCTVLRASVGDPLGVGIVTIPERCACVVQMGDALAAAQAHVLLMALCTQATHTQTMGNRSETQRTSAH